MIELTDRAVDDAYRHGIADLIAHQPHPTAEVRQRRVPVLVAIVGVAIPLAALALAAIVVIASHAQHSTVPATAATPSSPAAVIGSLGHTVRIGATVVPAASVTVIGVTYIPANSSAQPAPMYGLFAVATVEVYLPEDLKSSQLTQDEATASDLSTQMESAVLANDEVRAKELRVLLTRAEMRLARDELALMPFSLEYVASDGESYGAWDGNSPDADAPSLDAGLLTLPGLTTFEVVFDVSSSAGVLQLKDSKGRVVGRWQAPAE
jgi:hypothetical protein